MWQCQSNEFRKCAARIVCARGYRQYLTPYRLQWATDKQVSASWPTLKGAASPRYVIIQVWHWDYNLQSQPFRVRKWFLLLLGQSHSRVTVSESSFPGVCMSGAGLCPGVGPSSMTKCRSCTWLMPRAAWRPPWHEVLCCVGENYSRELGSQFTRCTIFVIASSSRG